MHYCCLVNAVTVGRIFELGRQRTRAGYKNRLHPGSRSWDSELSGVTPEWLCVAAQGLWQRTKLGSVCETCGAKPGHRGLHQPSGVALWRDSHTQRSALCDFQRYNIADPSGQQLITGGHFLCGCITTKPSFGVLPWLVIDRGCLLWGHISMDFSSQVPCHSPAGSCVA